MLLTGIFNLSFQTVITKTSVKMNLEKLFTRRGFLSPTVTKVVAFFFFFFKQLSEVQPCPLQTKAPAHKSFLDGYGLLCARSKKSLHLCVLLFSL